MPGVLFWYSKGYSVHYLCPHPSCLWRWLWRREGGVRAKTRLVTDPFSPCCGGPYPPSSEPWRNHWGIQHRNYTWPWPLQPLYGVSQVKAAWMNTLQRSWGRVSVQCCSLALCQGKIEMSECQLPESIEKSILYSCTDWVHSATNKYR